MINIKIILLLFSFFLISTSSWADDISKESSLSSNNLNYEQSTLKESPEKTIEEFFENNVKQKKHPLKLEWTATEGADFYEIEITKFRTCTRRYFKTTKNALDIVIFPNARYLWRVMAYSKDNILTEYSPKYKLYLRTPLGAHIVSKVEEPYSEEASRDVASTSDESVCKYPTVEALNQNVVDEAKLEKPKELTNITEKTTEEVPVALAKPVQEEKNKNIDRLPAYSYANKYSLWGRSWIKGGLSFNGYFYNQEIADSNEITHETVSSPAYYGEFGTFFSSQFGLVLSGNLSSGDIEDSATNLNKSYTTQKITAEGIYLLGSDWKTTKKSQFHLKFGMGYSSTPIIEALSSNNSFNIIDSKIISATAGVGYKNKITDKFRPELGLSVSYPVNFATNGSSIDLDSGLSVDFSAAINYQLYKNYQIGLFWKSEFTNLDYTQDDGLNNFSGNVFIINNHLGLFLGLEF